jgi:hypothetical protein
LITTRRRKDTTVIVSSTSIPFLIFAIVNLILPTTTTAALAQSAPTAVVIEKEQVFINKDNIKNYTSHGSPLVSSDYRDVYNPTKVFDNLLPTTDVPNTKWSDYDDADFTILLKNKLDRVICSAEIIQETPRNSPFLLSLSTQSVEGVLDSTTKTVTFPTCVKDVKDITLQVIAPDKWTSISEIKLFTDKKIPPPEPPICPPGTYYDSNLEKCVENVPNPVNQTVLVTNSTINFDIVNSTLKIHADSISNIIIDANDANVTTTNSNNTSFHGPTTPIGTPLPPPPTSDDDDDDKEGEDDDN